MIGVKGGGLRLEEVTNQSSDDWPDNETMVFAALLWDTDTRPSPSQPHSHH